MRILHYAALTRNELEELLGLVGRYAVSEFGIREGSFQFMQEHGRGKEFVCSFEPISKDSTG
jgi:hypothetical protein